MKARKITAIILMAVMMACSVIFAAPNNTQAATKTGVGMAEWAWRAYNENWRYVYGGASVGRVDCAGLIRSYHNNGYLSGEQYWNASVKGRLTKVNGSRNIPKIHGLAVYIPKEVSGSSDNHIGIYVGKDADGNDIVIDARNSKKGIQKSSLNSWAWNDWLKISGIDYPKANT